MREIKFRAWDKKDKHWVDPDRFYIRGMAERGVWHRPTGNRLDVELMQFTGLKDRDGKEIYEGDMVKEFSGIGVGEVKFGKFDVGSPCHGESVVFGWFYHKDHGGTNMLHGDLLIIGNIYENSDL